MKPDLTDITLVIDRSGSMEEIRTDAEGGVNAFIREAAQQPGEALLTLVQFDDEYEFVHRGVPIKEVPPYTLVPRSGTALLDAVGRAINETGERLAKMAEQDRPGLVIFVIVTDGEENQSREFSKARVKEMIQRQQTEYNWHFTFLGADQDAFAEAGGLGIAAGGTANFAKNKVDAAFIGTIKKVGRMRTQRLTGQAVSNEFTEEERKEMECDEHSGDDVAYVLSEQDRSIITATNILLRKIARLPAITPRQREAVAKVCEVFGRLPQISEELNIAISLTGPRRSYGEHKISHWWRVAVTGNELEVSSGGDFYRPSTGGDSFTCMEWQAAPGYEANYDDYLDRHQIVDDAQPYEIEVARLAITEPGFYLSVDLDGEELDSEADEEREEQLNEEPERETSYYFWRWADNELPGKPPDVRAALQRGELHPALQSFDARLLLNAVEEAATEGRVVGEEWKWELHPPASPENAWFVIVTCPHINTFRERVERFLDRFSPLGLSGCDDEGGKLIPGFFPKLNQFVTGQLPDCDSGYDITADDLPFLLRRIRPDQPEPWGELCTPQNAVAVIAEGRRFRVEWREWPDLKDRTKFLQWRARDPKRLTALAGRDDTQELPRQIDPDFLTYTEALRILDSFMRGESRPPKYCWQQINKFTFE